MKLRLICVMNATSKACNLEQNESLCIIVPLPSNEFRNAKQLHLVCFETVQYLFTSYEPCGCGDFGYCLKSHSGDES